MSVPVRVALDPDVRAYLQKLVEDAVSLSIQQRRERSSVRITCVENGYLVVHNATGESYIFERFDETPRNLADPNSVVAHLTRFFNQQ